MEEFFVEEKQKDIMVEQRKKLKRILKLNSKKNEENSEFKDFIHLFTWKMLIYDNYSKSVMSSLLKVFNIKQFIIGW